jgi:hypothetical protein
MQQQIQNFLKSPWRSYNSLRYQVLFSATCILICIVGLIVDHRIITGEYAWIKPCKFSISLCIYGLTLLLLSPYLSRYHKVFKAVCILTFIGTVTELSVIILQVIRGTTSHFNTSSVLNHIIFWITVAGILPVTLGVVVIFLLLLRDKSLPPVFGYALRWSFFLCVAGSIPGIIMLLPDPVQNVITGYKQFEGHTIGFTEGGPGLPWLGWSMVAGDLRPVHFLGIHSLQIFPLICYLAIKLFPNLSVEQQKLLIWNAGSSYFAIMCLLVWQALSAEPIVAPSQRTITGFAIIATVSAFWFIRAVWPQARVQA